MVTSGLLCAERKVNRKSASVRCSHGRASRGYACRECKRDGTGGKGICPHDKPRTQCRACNGVSFCEHDRLRAFCRKCKGSAICCHNKFRPHCRACGGVAFCIHNRQRAICIDCKGKNLCKHNRQRIQCIECQPLEMLLKKKNFCNACGIVQISRNKSLTTGFCASCDSTKNTRTEVLVRDRVLARMPPPSAVDNTLVGGKHCNEARRRPDLAWVGSDRIVMLEIDEHSHEDREPSCEIAKLDSTRWGVSNGFTKEQHIAVITVRMNPDECNTNRMAPKFDARCQRTADLLTFYIGCALSVLDPLRANVHYLFYHSKGDKHIEAARACHDNINVIAVE
jgi:hypothetical protein